MWMLLTPLLVASAHAETIDRIIAVVGNELILQSDIQLDALLTPVDASPSDFWTRPTEDYAQRLADAAMLRNRAGDLAIYQPSREDTARRLGYIEASYPGFSAKMQRLGFDRGHLETALRRRMVVERYLDRDLMVMRPGPDAWLEALDALLESERATHQVRWIPAGEPR